MNWSIRVFTIEKMNNVILIRGIPQLNIKLKENPKYHLDQIKTY